MGQRDLRAKDQHILEMREEGGCCGVSLSRKYYEKENMK